MIIAIILISYAVSLIIASSALLIATFLQKPVVLSISWAVSIATIGFIAMSYSKNYSTPAIIIVLMILFWALDLIYRLLKNPISKMQAVTLSNQEILKNILKIVIPISLLAMIVSAPSWMVSGSSPFCITILGLIGFYFSSFSSRFLVRSSNRPAFIKNSMHPLYWDDLFTWWGIFLIAVQSEAGLWTIISPITITIIPLLLSGITLLNTQLLDASYHTKFAKQASNLFPWWPKI